MCGKPLADEPQITVGTVYQSKDGEKVEGSETVVGVFHPDCWSAYKTAHPEIADPPA